MSDAVSAQIVSPLGHAAFDGFAKVREIGPVGMISLRAKADVPGLGSGDHGGGRNARFRPRVRSKLRANARRVG